MTIEKILLIDEDKKLTNLFSCLFSKMGFGVYSTNNSNEALNIYEKNKIDVVISDYNIQPINGAILITQLKGMNNNPKCKYILMATSEIQEEKKRELEQLSDNEILSKPYNVGNICSKIR